MLKHIQLVQWGSLVYTAQKTVLIDPLLALTLSIFWVVASSSMLPSQGGSAQTKEGKEEILQSKGKQLRPLTSQIKQYPEPKWSVRAVTPTQGKPKFKVWKRGPMETHCVEGLASPHLIIEKQMLLHITNIWIITKQIVLFWKVWPTN